MRLLSLLLLFISLVCQVRAQDDFRAYSSSYEMIEGGRIDTMVALLNGYRFTTRVPNKFSTHIDSDKRSIVFTDASGSTAITMQVTTNSPGGLPPDDTLHEQAVSADAGGSFIQLVGANAGGHPCRYVDTVRLMHNDLAIRTRYVFVQTSEGIVDFIYTSKSEDFEKGRIVLNQVLNSFRVEQELPAKKQ